MNTRDSFAEDVVASRATVKVPGRRNPAFESCTVFLIARQSRLDLKSPDPTRAGRPVYGLPYVSHRNFPSQSHAEARSSFATTTTARSTAVQ